MSNRKKTSWKQRKKDLDSMPIEEQYKVLAMRADKRLQRLEKYMKRPGYDTIDKGAYARAIRDIEVWKGKGHKRFGIRPPKNVEELQAKINDIKSFLRADTSTLKPGMGTQGFAISVYEKQAKTFNSRYNANLSWQELANFYGSETATKIANEIRASKTVALALGQFKRMFRRNSKLTNEDLIERIKNNKNRSLSKNEAVNQVMKDMIEMGFDPQDVFIKKGKRK